MQSLQEHLQFLRQLSLSLRMDLLTMLYRAQSGHMGGSLSSIDILSVLYFGQLHSGPLMNYDARKPGWEGQDYFILSKAHAAPAWYAVLAEAGFFPKEELHHLRQLNSLLQPYPLRKIPGVPAGASTPGQGLSTAVGLALALKMDKQPNRVFSLIGDGELQEGTVWEAALMASHNKLDNLVVFVDWNDLQNDGTVRGVVGVEPLADKFQAFGFKTIPVRDGHDTEELLFAVERAFETQRRPSVIVARTVKGKGVAFAENKAFYHSEVLSQQEMAEAIPMLEREMKSLLANI
jgi:transketolase